MSRNLIKIKKGIFVSLFMYRKKLHYSVYEYKFDNKIVKIIFALIYSKAIIIYFSNTHIEIFCESI